MDNSFSKIGLWVFIGLIVLFFTYNATVGKWYRKKIIANHVVVCGRIIQMQSGKSINVNYEFYYNNKRYEYTKGSPRNTYLNYKNGKLSILVAFQKNDPDNNTIISKDEDFLSYGITEQDTLNISCN